MAWIRGRRAAREKRTPHVVEASFSPIIERRSVLDRAHRGDVEGAFGTVGVTDTGPRRSLRRRLATFLAVMGPGVVVMVADNDAGGIATYAEAGQNHGPAMVWMLVVLAPILFVIQEMAARLGAVTGAGHARLIVERFGRRWGLFALGDLLVLNFLILVTEFIGVAFAAGAVGISRYVSVPVAALVIVAVTVGGGFRRWERTMLAMVAVSLVAVVLAVIVFRHGTPPSGVDMGPSPAPLGNNAAVVFVIALVGTTVAPWQLFFQQSYVVDKRLTPRWIAYVRVDTLLGTALFAIGAIAVLLASAWAFGGTALEGDFADTGSVVAGFRDQIGTAAAATFAIVLLNGSMLGAGAVTLSASYAIGDVFGARHSLHRAWRDATVFHGSFVGLIVVAAAVVLIPGTPLGVVTAGVQILAGVLLPSATVFLLLLANDRDVLGPWTNPAWLNVLAAIIIAVLVALSMLLTWTTLFGSVSLEMTMAVLAVATGLGIIGALFGQRSALPDPDAVHADAAAGGDRHRWTMPPLDELPPPRPSRRRTLALVVLRAYLLGAAALVVVKVVQTIIGG